MDAKKVHDAGLTLLVAVLCFTLGIGALALVQALLVPVLVLVAGYILARLIRTGTDPVTSLRDLYKAIKKWVTSLIGRFHD